MFFGRERELRTLNEHYNSKNLEFFEQICKEYMWKVKLPFNVSEIGR